MAEYILEMKGIVKKFPGTLALDNVDFNLKKGEVMALIGENGAGKSTLMNVLMGVYGCDAGEITLNGNKIENKSPYEALKNGIGMVPQELNLVSEITIAENIYLDSQKKKKGGIIDWKGMTKMADEALKSLEVDLDPNKKVGEISAAYQQLVSIARTLVAGSNIIILDEPTASLTDTETEHLFSIMRKLRADGKSIVMITHHLEEVVEMADRVTIMRDGRMVKCCNTKDITAEEMIFHMANEKIKKQVRIERNVSDELFMKVENYSRKGEFHDISFDVKKGEILGIAGLVGAGRTELMSCIYGLTKRDSGKLTIEGKETVFNTPNQAIANGIGLVPEERRKQGMFPELTIYENVMLPSYDRIKKGKFINYSAAKNCTVGEIEKLRIKTPSESTRIKDLSGGNQQKVILARWMEKKVKMLILDEPTRGIDVRAKGEIYDLIRNMANEGVTIVVVSSEVDELITIADRIMVMFNGEQKGIVKPDEHLTRQDILKIALQ